MRLFKADIEELHVFAGSRSNECLCNHCLGIIYDRVVIWFSNIHAGNYLYSRCSIYK